MKFTPIANKILIEELFKTNSGRLDRYFMSDSGDYKSQSTYMILFLTEEIYDKKLKMYFTEGTAWREAKKGYYYRTDPPNEINNFTREICIALKKHIRSKPQWTWYENGKRKDLHKMTKEPPKIVKQIASDFFGKKIDFLEAFLIDIGKNNEEILLD